MPFFRFLLYMTVLRLLHVVMLSGSVRAIAYRKCAMNYETVTVTPFMQNCRIIYCPVTLDAAIVDPGGDIERILEEVARLGVTPTQIWITHAHIDHVGGVAALQRALNVPVLGSHHDDLPLIAGLPQSAAMFGLPTPERYEPTRWLNDGDRLDLGEMQFEVMHCPGHAPGHIVFINHDARIMLAGDVLFRGSIGRTDLPGGDTAQLLASIQRLWPLGDDMRVLSGHGEPTTLGYERLHNPFVGINAPSF